jgi:hypothetical protein
MMEARQFSSSALENAWASSAVPPRIEVDVTEFVIKRHPVSTFVVQAYGELGSAVCKHLFFLAKWKLDKFCHLISREAKLYVPITTYDFCIVS